MTTPAALLRASITSLLQQQLKASHCSRASVRYQPSSLTVFQGVKDDGSDVLRFLTDRELDALLSAYCEATGAAGLIVDIDAARDLADFHPQSAAALETGVRASKQQREAEAQEKLMQYRCDLESRTQIYGEALAQAVALELERGRGFGQAHRDYCGMGLEYRDGLWRYGELYDGVMYETDQQWRERQDFIDWLAHRSDASLARLDTDDPFYWGNQTVSRSRLENWLDEAGR